MKYLENKRNGCTKLRYKTEKKTSVLPLLGSKNCSFFGSRSRQWLVKAVNVKTVRSSSKDSLSLSLSLSLSDPLYVTSRTDLQLPKLKLSLPSLLEINDAGGCHWRVACGCDWRVGILLFYWILDGNGCRGWIKQMD